MSQKTGKGQRSLYSPINKDDDSQNFTKSLVELQLSDQKINPIEEDSLSFLSSTDSSDSDDIKDYFSSRQKQYASTLKQIMEQELEEPEFGHMMDKIIRMLIYLAHSTQDDDPKTSDINSAIKYLKNQSVQDAITAIGAHDEQLATDFQDSFSDKHEMAAMEIMLEICMKILNMRKLINDYPMIFVPISFKLYQPRFMTKKSERKHKLKKQKKQRVKERRRSSVLSSNISNIKHNRFSSNINDIDEENSLSELSGDHTQALTDENINNKFKNTNNNDDSKINHTQSLPVQTNQQLKCKNTQKRSKTSSKVRFQKTRSGLSLALLPIPRRSSKIFGKNGGHFSDQSTIFKHRLSDVSKDQINIVRSSIISPSMNDIEEEDIIDNTQNVRIDSIYIKNACKSTINNISLSRKSSHKLIRKSAESNKLREWAKAFVFKQVGEITYDELMREYIQKGKTLICEGCQTEIKLKESNRLNSMKLKQYEAGESDRNVNNDNNISHGEIYNTNDKFKKPFLFHDLYCETLRKYKEAIRQYAFEYEFNERYQRIPELNDPDRLLHLFALKDDLLVVDSALSRNAKKQEDKKPHKPRFKNRNHGHYHLHYNQKDKADRSHSSMGWQSDFYVDSTDAGLRRERRLALLNLYREAEKKVQLPKELSMQRTIQQLDNETSNELPELLRYIDVTTFGRPLWYFCVDQLSTKDRPPLWNILEFLATELPTSMAINILKSTRDALVRFQVEPLDAVCLKIISASTYPIATALYLAAFMQSNATRDSSRKEKFDIISKKYIDIGTDLLSQIESDHLLAILIEIPSNIDGLSILDI
eukprot:444772_1